MLSIIVPTLNEEKYLPKLLESIKRQSYTYYEVIVADNNSKDDTRKIAEKYGCNVVDGGLPAKGRNRGAEAARGDYLLFLDADVRLPKSFLKKSMQEFEEKFLDIATCNVRAMSEKKADRLIMNYYTEFLKIAQHIYPHAPGFCILCTKRIFNRVGGFDESIRLGEDNDFCIRAARLARFRVLEKPYLYVSVRRLDKEGRLGLIKKSIVGRTYELVTGNQAEFIEYEFGSYDNVSRKRQASLLKQQRGIVKKRIMQLRQEYKKVHDRLVKVSDEIEGEYNKIRKRIRV